MEDRFKILNVLTESSGITDYGELLSFEELIKRINKLDKENKRLKQALQNDILMTLMDNISPKCEICGEKLPTFPFYSEDYELRKCSNCGHMNRRKIHGR